MQTLTKLNRNRQIVDGFTSWKSPKACSAEMVTYPFEGDLKNYIISQDYMMFSDYYLDNVPAQGTPHPVYAGMYFIKDEKTQDVGAGIIKFTRSWGILPGFVTDNKGITQTVRKECESYVWTRPGISTIAQLYLQWWVDNDKLVAGSDASKVKLYDTLKNPNDDPNTGERWAHDVNSNYDYASINYLAWTSVNTATSLYNQYTYTSPIHSRGTDWIEVDRAPVNNGVSNYPMSYVWFSRPQIAIKPQQVVVNSIVHFDYWLPGVNCTNIESIPLLSDEVFTIYDINLNITDTITEDTNPPLNTNLLHEGYKQMKARGAEILVENPTIRRWNGPIFERQRRYIVIQ